MRNPRIHSGWLAAFAFMAALPLAAAPVNFSRTFQVASVDAGITGLQPGDLVTIEFTIDDSVTDTNASVGAGQFPSLMTAFSASVDPANGGSWDPAGGTWDLPGSNYVTNAYGSNITFEVRGSSVPDGGAGLDFHRFDLGFAAPGMTDSGTGDTFAEQVGPGFDLNEAWMRGAITFTDGEDYFEARLRAPLAAAAPADVPATGPFANAALALILAAVAFVALRFGAR